MCFYWILVISKCLLKGKIPLLRRFVEAELLPISSISSVQGHLNDLPSLLTNTTKLFVVFRFFCVIDGLLAKFVLEIFIWRFAAGPTILATRFLLLGEEVVAYNKGYNFNIVACKLQSFLEHFSTFPNGFLVGGPADFFVNELSDQLQKLKVEPVLLHYFSQIKVLQGMELRMTTNTRLKSCLYSFTSPSGPMYPTRAVCHAAWDVLDMIFPARQYPWHLISLFFRLLYPWYWPSSYWNFVISCIKAILFSVFELIISNWEKLRRPKRF
ncbi:hypothetical protein UlMin_025616 [Ulmus minor]